MENKQTDKQLGLYPIVMKSLSVRMRLSIILSGALIVLIIVLLICNYVRNSIYRNSVDQMIEDTSTHLHSIAVFIDKADLQTIDDLDKFPTISSQILEKLIQVKIILQLF